MMHPSSVTDIHTHSVQTYGHFDTWLPGCFSYSMACLDGYSLAITLTYMPSHVPVGGSPDIQAPMTRDCSTHAHKCSHTRSQNRGHKMEKLAVSSKSGIYIACNMTGRWPSESCLQGWGKGKGSGKTEDRWRGWGVWLGESALLKEELRGWQQRFSVRDRRLKSRVPGWKARHPLSGWGSNLPSLLQASHQDAAAWDRYAKETWQYLAGRKGS